MPHPLDPLTRDELAGAVAALRESGLPGAGQRSVSLALHEQGKERSDWDAAALAAGRRGLAVLFDPRSAETRECVIDVDGATVAWSMRG